MQALTTAPRPSPQVRDAGGQRLRLVHSLALTTAPRPSPQVRDAGGQRLRLVHSLAPRARAQFGAVWYHRKLPVRRGFEVRLMASDGV
jgi:hypothetical protein